MPKNFNGYLYALFAVFFWSFNVIYAKYLAVSLTPFEISFIRWAIPALLFLPFCIKSIIQNRQKFYRYWYLILILALSGLGFQNTFVYYAGHTSNAIDMALIGATSPIFMLILSIFFLHHKITFFEIIGIFCAITGVVTVILNGDFKNISKLTLTPGDLWMFLSAVIFAAYSIAERKLPSDIPPIPAFCLMICLSTLIFLPLAAWDFLHTSHPTLDKKEVLILFILAVFNSGLAYMAWNKAISSIGAVRTSAIYYLMPVFSAIEAYIILNEQIYAGQIYGTILIITGITLSNIKKKAPTSLPKAKSDKLL